MQWMVRRLTLSYANLADHGAIFSHFVIYTTLVTCMAKVCLQRQENF
jgi:hypothetical protein